MSGTVLLILVGSLFALGVGVLIAIGVIPLFSDYRKSRSTGTPLGRTTLSRDSLSGPSTRPPDRRSLG
jgi:hypothetical protein